MEKVDNMQDQMNNFSKKIESIGNNQMEMLGLQKKNPNMLKKRQKIQHGQQ